MPVAKEAFVAVGTAEFPPDPSHRSLDQRAVFHCPGWVAHHREAGTVGFLARGFPREKALERPSQPHDGSLRDEQLTAAITVVAEQVQPLEALQGGFCHADGTGVAFRQAMVSLVAPFPDAVVAGPVGPRHVIDQVLNEVRFIPALDDGQTAAGELGQLQQIERGGIQLQMPPGVIRHHRLTAAAVVFGVEGVSGVEAALEPLHFSGLPHHRPQQTAHQGQHALFQLPGPTAAVAMTSSVSEGKPPDALDGIDAVPHPGIAVIAVDGVGGAGRQQSADRILTLQHDLFDRSIQTLQDPVALAWVADGLRCRHNHEPLHHHP